MCRLLGYCSRGSASVAGLLSGEGLRAFTALSDFHSDGWGMAWYDADGLQLRKSARRAAQEPDYARLARRSLGDLGLLHLMWRLEARHGDMIAAAADTVASIAGRYAVNSLNAVVLSPAKMYVIAWHDPARIPVEELRRRGLGSTPGEFAGYFHL